MSLKCFEFFVTTVLFAWLRKYVFTTSVEYFARAKWILKPLAFEAKLLSYWEVWGLIPSSHSKVDFSSKSNLLYCIPSELDFKTKPDLFLIVAVVSHLM